MFYLYSTEAAQNTLSNSEFSHQWNNKKIHVQITIKKQSKSVENDQLGKTRELPQEK